MLKMRLQRIGRKNNPSYRVLVVDSRQGPKSGKFVDSIGSYDPIGDHLLLDGEKAGMWIKKGVQVSPTVHNLLIGQKIIEGKKINVLPRKSPIKKEGGATSATTIPGMETTPAEPPSVVHTPESVPATSTEGSAGSALAVETTSEEVPADQTAPA